MFLEMLLIKKVNIYCHVLHYYVFIAYIIMDGTYFKYSSFFSLKEIHLLIHYPVIHPRDVPSLFEICCLIEET